MKLPADHKGDVIFPSETSSFNENFIQEEKGAMILPASLFAARGNAKLLFILMRLLHLITFCDKFLEISQE